MQTKVIKSLVSRVSTKVKFSNHLLIKCATDWSIIICGQHKQERKRENEKEKRNGCRKYRARCGMKTNVHTDKTDSTPHERNNDGKDQQEHYNNRIHRIGNKC